MAMFEDILLESGHQIKTKSKYYTIVGFALNGSVLAALILYPLIYPEALPKAMMATLLVALRLRLHLRLRLRPRLSRSSTSSPKCSTTSSPRPPGFPMTSSW
jgi:hypothetical protein